MNSKELLKIGFVYSPQMLKRYPVIIILLLLPLLFINMRDSHDWGDDFAQYLMQARNIVEGRSQTENGLIFDSLSGKFAVQAYPVGFPLLISPVYALSGIEIRPYLILGTIFLILLAWSCQRYFRIFFEERLSLLLMLYFTYHVYTLDLKTQILSEIPFTLFLMLIFLKLRSGGKTAGHWLSLGLLAGFLCSIRIVGILCIPALAAFLIVNYIKNKSNEDFKTITRKKVFLLFITANTVSFWFLNNILFAIPFFDFFDFYNRATTENGIHLLSNLQTYLELFGSIFHLPFLQSYWWAIICGLLIFTGYIHAFKRNNHFEEWWILLYLLVLGFYPYTSGGFRFLFPVFPLFIRYFFEGLGIFAELIRKIPVRKVQILSCVLLLVASIQPFNEVLKNSGKPVQGPQSAEAKEMFAYIRDNTAKGATIVFPRARAMALYADRPVTYLLQKKSPEENAELFYRLRVEYIVLAKDFEKSPLFDPALRKYFTMQKSDMELKWENRDFEVYKLISH